MSGETDNPFYRNFLFSEFDIQRHTFKKWHHPILWLKPTWVQIADGYAFFYKLSGHRIWLWGYEPLPRLSIPTAESEKEGEPHE